MYRSVCALTLSKPHDQSLLMSLLHLMGLANWQADERMTCSMTAQSDVPGSPCQFVQTAGFPLVHVQPLTHYEESN